MFDLNAFLLYNFHAMGHKPVPHGQRTLIQQYVLTKFYMTHSTHCVNQKKNLNLLLDPFPGTHSPLCAYSRVWHQTLLWPNLFELWLSRIITWKTHSHHTIFIWWDFATVKTWSFLARLNLKIYFKYDSWWIILKNLKFLFLYFVSRDLK